MLLLTKADIAARILTLAPGEQRLAAAAAIALYGTANSKTPEQTALEADYQVWLRTLFPHYFSRSFAPHHIKFWNWAWAVARGVRPRSEVDIWSRGHGKSTNAEAVCAAWGARGTRRYVWYLSGTQDQADDHVGNVASMLESDSVQEFYPAIGRRLVNKFGSVKGWKRNRIRTSTGFTVDALGIDAAKRGVKLEAQRPDGIIIDDVDGKHDTPQKTQKKIEIITHSILPSGSTHELAVLAVQNLIIKDGIFSQLADDRADWLADREVNGPVPALRNFDFVKQPRSTSYPRGRNLITSGEPTWDGMDVPACQLLIDNEGIESFLRERQHKVELNLPGAIFPEWSEVHHVITESEFKSFYGLTARRDPEQANSPCRIPHNWNLGRGLDWGTTIGHPMVTEFAARPYETHELTDSVFVYREITRPKFPFDDEDAQPVNPRRVMKAILAATKHDQEEARMQISAMSHEASAAYNTFMDLMAGDENLWFNKWKAQVGSGVPQIQDALEIDHTKDHPFRCYPANYSDKALCGKPLKGRPRFFVLVPDAQGALYCDDEGQLKVRGAVNSLGMARLRYEFPKYRNPITATGQEKSKPNPKVHGEDDAIDALKGLANVFFPAIQRMSEEDRIDSLLPEPLKRASIRERQKRGDNVQGAIAHRLHTAGAIKKKLQRGKTYSPLADYRRRLKEGK
jgi:hypothetical protein